MANTNSNSEEIERLKIISEYIELIYDIELYDEKYYFYKEQINNILNLFVKEAEILKNLLNESEYNHIENEAISLMKLIIDETEIIFKLIYSK